MIRRLCLLACSWLCCESSWVLAETPGSPTALRTGIEARVAWTTSRIAGTPDPPPPYRVEPAFPKLTFHRPLDITNAPGTERLFVAEQDGKIYSFENDPACERLDLALDLKQRFANLTAVYGLTFHPDFARNRQVFICYVLGNETPDGSRVSRFTMKAGSPPQIDSESEQVLITWWAGGHNGGCLKFGPDKYLYISTGDGGGPSPPDPLRSGQDVTNLLSSVLRIDVDQADEGKAYRVPPDNPLVNIPQARPEIWAYGFRNPWKMSFDRGTGDLWAGDVGWELWELVYKIEKGGNYGWSIMEGRQPVYPEGARGPTPILPPTIDHPHSEAASITGGFVYRGSRLSKLHGAYIYGDFQSGKIWGLRHDGQSVVWHEELAQTPLQLVAFGEDNSGELYLVDYERSKQIYRLEENPDTGSHADFPTRLSETGLFASVPKHEPAAGVIPYSINAEQWADHASAERFLAIPGTGQIEIDDKGNWLAPDGSVLFKTVSLEMRKGDVGSRRRVETQVLHREAGSWRPYTYVWNDDQTDAELAAAAGSERQFRIEDPAAPGGIREHTHRIAARSECLLCHNPWVEKKTTIFGFQSASPLAFYGSQFNRDHKYPQGTACQLATFVHIHLLAGQVPADLDQVPRMANPYDPQADLSERARAYLHVNCSHCHQFNAGGAATIVLSHETKLEETRMVDVRPSQGTFGISEAKIISPGDPLGSVLYYRIAKLGGGRMPRAGSHEVDERALTLIHDWIAQMPRTPATGQGKSGALGLHAEDAAAIEQLRQPNSAEVRTAAVNRLTSTTRGALALLGLLGDPKLETQVRGLAVELTKNHAAVEVRDLFERFLPESERVQRLGESIEPDELLSLPADADRGKRVFFSEGAAGCKNCHRIENTGEPLGPDLSQIAKKYSRPQLLQHILAPSQFMDPKYVPYILETSDGRVLSGLLAEKTDHEVVLKDAKNQTLRIAAEDVELLVPQQKSLMPELLLRDMTPQQVADLIAYLDTLR